MISLCDYIIIFLWFDWILDDFILFLGLDSKGDFQKLFL